MMMDTVSTEARGKLVAQALAGAWRVSPSPWECSAAELEQVTPLLLNSGAAALVWRRLRTDLRDTPAAQKFQQAYRLNTVKTALHQGSIERAVALLRSIAVEPILIKGLAAARAYPQQGLRTCADVDLCVRPEQFAAAVEAVKDFNERRCEIDLHCGFEKFGHADMNEIYARSESVRIRKTNVRVPCEEDHLRVLSVHLLREGAWRPLWLCDVAAAVESRKENFDWERCLTKHRRVADWVICAMRLAHELIGADVNATPAAEREKPLPRWIVPTILREWASPHPSMTQRHRAPMASLMRQPAGIFKGLRHRWPNPIEATVTGRGRFNNLPRFPLQLGNCFVRTARFLARSV
jgi:hypothetical protein